LLLISRNQISVELFASISRLLYNFPMVSVKKLWGQNHTFLILICLYGLTRLYNLLILPIFTDESIYIYWAKLIQTTHAQWFISLTDGKPPLLVWMTAILLQIFPQKWYLLAGRLPSVFSGFLAVVAIYKLAVLLFKSKKAGYIAMLLYIFSPFTFLYDRMALYDSLLCSMLLWAVYYAFKTAQTLSVYDAIKWGFFIGLGFYSKAPAILYEVLAPIIFLLNTPFKMLTKKYKTYALIIGAAVLTGEIINNTQRFSHVYDAAAIKNAQFQEPLSEILKDPLRLTISNLHAFSDWIIHYYTLPLFLFGIVSFFVVTIKKPRIGISLVLLWLIPLIAFSVFGREIFPRYILFTLPYMLLSITFVFTLLFKKSILQKSITIILFLFLLALPLQFDYYLVTNPAKAPMPETDYKQYVSEHPSGYGVNEVIAYINNALKNGPVTLVTEGTFGLYPYAFTLEYWDDKNVHIVPRWPLSDIDSSIKDAAKTSQVFVLLKEHDKVPENLPLKVVVRFEKPGKKYPLLLTTLKDE
jgi:4-amino-4-deoxy-L-arabinose transferase-like glycosyltransferase